MTRTRLRPSPTTPTAAAWSFALLAVCLTLAVPTRLTAQMSPPGGPAPEPLLTAQVPAVPGSTYSRFELLVTASSEGVVPFDLLDPSTMPTLVISSFLNQPWGEIAGPEIRINLPFWEEIETIARVFDPFLEHDPEIDLEDLHGILEAAEAVKDLVDFELPTDAEDILDALVDGLWTHGFDFVAGLPFGGPSCLVPVLETGAALSFAAVTHVAVGATFLLSPVTCLNPVPESGGQLKCAGQILAWLEGARAMLDAFPHGIAAYRHHSSFVSYVKADQVGQTLHAAQTHAADSMREAKLCEQAAGYTETDIERASTMLDRITDLGAGDVVLDRVALPESRALSAAKSFWNATHSCMRNVIAPRLEASVVRNRFFMHTDDGLVALPGIGGTDLSALPRPLAKENLIEIDVDDLYAANPDFISYFNPVEQRQNVTVYLCEGMVIGKDPGTLTRPPQHANTHHYIGHFTAHHGCVGDWWRGLGLHGTELNRPLAPTTMHRACESQGFIDNNNDGLADASASEHCYLAPNETDPADEKEEDLFWASSVPSISGVTTFSTSGVDMLCNAATLSLVSEDGLTDRQVRQEVVFNTGSCWTRESDGLELRDHPHPWSQIRFAIRDDSWGAPRPRECYAYDTETLRWGCTGIPGCRCIGDGPNTVPVGPQ